MKEKGELRELEKIVGKMTSPFSDSNVSFLAPTSGFFDFQELGGGGGRGETLGFVDLFEQQDFSPSLSNSTPIPFHPTFPAPVSSETVNLPATPNSSTISSTSTEGSMEADPHVMSAAESDRGKKTRTDSKEGKKKGQKRQKEPRFAFVTKSDVDNLEDGYRWRKYGQKAVKNSPYPRSYFRCTSALCGVKKRVERSSEDPTVVVTTYEGKHTHHSPVAPRATRPFLTNSPTPSSVSAAFAPPGIGDLRRGLQTCFPSSSPFLLSSRPSDFHRTISTAPPPCILASAPATCDDREYCAPVAATETGLRDHGLLQDLIPSVLKKKEQ